MRLDQLKLTNFRGFESLEITFDPQVTVLVGANMAGKTAALGGIAVALGHYIAGIEVARSGGSAVSPRPIRQSDARRVIHKLGGTPDLQLAGPPRLSAQAFADGQVWRWTDDEGPRSIGQLAKSVARHVQAGKPAMLPVLTSYGTSRLWRVGGPPDLPSGIGSRFDGYDDCLDVGVSPQRFMGWLKKQTLIQLQRGREHQQPQLAAVVAAVMSCVSDVTHLWYDVEYDELMLQRGDGDLQSFGMLSDGYRNMVALVADLAWRSAVLNPQFGTDAHLNVDGVVLIDEVELHLHPGWQRRVLDDLRRTFPKLQFIVTTHSPQVVASVSRSQVRLLENNMLIASDLFVEGRDTNELLEDVFGVPSRPEAAKAELRHLYQLIEAGDHVAARGKLAELEQRLGPDDAQIVRAGWILDSEEADREAQRAAGT